jgi:hypothetical protein
MKSTIALTISGLLLGLVDVAHAAGTFSPPPTATYVFTASGDSPNIFHGSTITIDTTGSGGILSEDLTMSIKDTGLGTTPFTDDQTFAAGTIPYDTTDWVGKVSFDSGSYDFTISGTPDSIDEQGVATTLDPIVPADPFAGGVWAYVPAAAPDASSTFPMLLGVLTTLAGVYHRNRPKSVTLA